MYVSVAMFPLYNHLYHAMFQILRLQNNGYDCGVWVLAAMIAVLHGRHVMGVHEVDIGNLRHYLSVLVLSIPSN